MRALSFGAALALHLAWTQWIFGQLGPAVLWVGLSASALGWLRAAYLPSRGRWLAWYHVGLTAALILAFAVMSMFRPGYPGGATARARRVVSEEAPKGMPDDAAEGERHAGGMFRSVILLAEADPSRVMAPPLPSSEESDGVRLSEPLTIPFFGAYWFFRLPAKSPGANAFVRRGTPVELLFRSADLAPLEMEARQSLGRHLDLRCCERIDVVVTNADTASGTVSLELRVADSSMPGRPNNWLGRVLVPCGGRIETLSFPLPRRPVLARFNELIVVFHRTSETRARSAKVAVERFVLIPR